MSYNVPPEGASYQVPNSSMAIVSLIAGILGLTFFPLLGSIVALITGILASLLPSSRAARLDPVQALNKK